MNVYFFLGALLFSLTTYGIQPVKHSAQKARHFNKLLLAAAQADDVKKVKEALTHGANCNVSDNLGYTPLCKAVLYDRPAVAALLLDIAAVNVNVQTKNGLTPLHLKVSRDTKTRIIRWLLEAGADYDLKDSFGETVLQKALRLSLHEQNEFRKNRLLSIITLIQRAQQLKTSSCIALHTLAEKLPKDVVAVIAQYCGLRSRK